MIVLHSDVSLQIGASALYDFVSITVLTRTNIDRRIESFIHAGADIVRPRFTPVSFSPTIDSEQFPWRYPEGCKTKSSSNKMLGSAISISSALNQLSGEEMDDSHGSALLVHGSLISIPTNNSSVITYRLQLEATAGNKRREKNPLSPALDNQKDHSKYVMRAEDLANATFDDNFCEMPTLSTIRY
jgi:hypothetical protein